MQGRQYAIATKCRCQSRSAFSTDVVVTEVKGVELELRVLVMVGRVAAARIPTYTQTTGGTDTDYNSLKVRTRANGSRKMGHK
jgi:hypothetical protein